MPVQFLSAVDGSKIAYVKVAAQSDNDLPYVLFIHGFRSDMDGGKALYLEEQCRARGQGFIRFDCFAHGQSDGDFSNFTIGRAMDDTEAVLDQLTEGRSAILVGSSMGGWVALAVAQQRPKTIVGIVGIAAAPDFTRELYAELSEDERLNLEKEGHALLPNPYGDPYIITQKLVEDGESHCLLDGTITYDGPVHLLQGKMDKSVPWQKAGWIGEALASEDIAITYIDDGDHRLSRDEDMEKIDLAIRNLLHH